MNRIQRGFSVAEGAARLVTHSRYRVGAAIFLGARLISVGWNQDKTHPKQRSIFKWHHAETSALIGTSRRDLSRATIFVVRITGRGKWRISRPCPDCEAMLRASGIRRVWYSDRDGVPHYLNLKEK